MPIPKVWQTESEFVEELRLYWSSRVFARGNGEIDWPAAINNSVKGNTFRAFRKLRRQPSRVFRDWAYDALVLRRSLDGLSRVQSQSEYDGWLLALVEDLRKYWKHEMRVPLPFGPSYKLPNLLMKGLNERLQTAEFKGTTEFFHVALDSYTLAGVRNFIVLSDGRKIPKGASMGFIKTEADYQELQNGIRSLAARAGVHPIAYDYLAWDVRH